MEQKQEIKPIKETDDGGVECPYCGIDLTCLYENCDLEQVWHSPITVIKDPCYSEATSGMTVHWKCPVCGQSMEDYVSWDN